MTTQEGADALLKTLQQAFVWKRWDLFLATLSYIQAAGGKVAMLGEEGNDWGKLFVIAYL